MAEEKIIQLTDSEDVARARAFWNDHGKPIVFGVLMGISGVVGFNYWNVYQQNQGEQASELFAQLNSSAEIETAIALSNELTEDYGDSLYAALGALSLAKKQVLAGQYDDAQAQLNWILQNSQDEGIQHIARLRLASILSATESYDEMLELLDQTNSEQINSEYFSGRYSELRGDAYAGRNGDGDYSKARAAYLLSLAQLVENSTNADLIQLKLDNLPAQ